MQLPDFTHARTVVPVSPRGEGHSAGAPTALWDGERFLIAWREVHPLGLDASIHLATSTDGETLTEVGVVGGRIFRAQSLDRPALVTTQDGDIRLYVTCSTARSKHWWIDSLTADSLENLPHGTRRIILPGSGDSALKDPVVMRDGHRWRMWVSRYPLDEDETADRSCTRYHISRDGVNWIDRGPVLQGREDGWERRATRVTAILADEPLTVLFDGRPDVESLGRETTGVAVADAEGVFTVDDQVQLTSPDGDGSLRFVTRVPLPDGSVRWYAEKAHEDGSHDLVTVLTVT